jgi:hypothetical protein
MARSRKDKLEVLSNWKPAQNYLHSCLTESFNCGVCQKCKRNLIILDGLGVLDKFSKVYDIDEYRENRDNVLRWMCEQKAKEWHSFEYLKEAYDIIKKREPDKIRQIEDNLSTENLIDMKNHNELLQKKYRRYLGVTVEFAADNKRKQRLAAFFSERNYKNIILYWTVKSFQSSFCRAGQDNIQNFTKTIAL